MSQKSINLVVASMKLVKSWQDVTVKPPDVDKLVVEMSCSTSDINEFAWKAKKLFFVLKGQGGLVDADVLSSFEMALADIGLLDEHAYAKQALEANRRALSDEAKELLSQAMA